MDDDHLKPQKVMTADGFIEALHDPINLVADEDRLGATTIRVSRIRVEETCRLYCTSLRLAPNVDPPIVLDHCVFNDLEIFGTDETTEGTRPEVDFVECGLLQVRAFNRFSWIRVVRSNVGEAQFNGQIESLVLNGRAEKTWLGGSVREIWLGGWSTDRLFVSVADDCAFRLNSAAKGTPLTVRDYAWTDRPAWTKALRLLCPTTPIVFGKEVRLLKRA